MNVSDSRKVVLSALKEIPYEITFMLSDATQDPNIKNRYWFDFPNQWANIPNKDAIIGIRSIYTTKTNRFIRYSYKIELIPITDNEPIDTIEGTIDHWIEGDETVRYICHTWADENRGWLNGSRTNVCTDEQHSWSYREIVCYYGYDRTTNTTHLCFGRKIGDSRTIMVKDSEDMDVECEYRISITPESDDAKALFGFDEERKAMTRFEIPVWSRDECLVKSSLANDDKNNILGHTGTQTYNPIKYFRLNSSDKRFWIELYETRFPKCPVSLPMNNQQLDRDDLFVESIVGFSTDAML